MACEKVHLEMTCKSACCDQAVWRAQTKWGLCKVNSRFNKVEHSKLAVLTHFQGLKPVLTHISQPQVDCLQLRWAF